jgi:regulatory protein
MQRRRRPAHGRSAKADEPSQPESAANRAARLLALRPLSRKELEGRLVSAGYPEAEIGLALNELERRRFLDDRGLAESVVRQRGLGRGYGRVRLWAELQRRGVARADAEEAMASGFGPGAEEELALVVARRRARSRRGADPRVLRAQLGSFLTRRGFSEAAVARALRRLQLEGGLRSEESGDVDL